MKKNKTGLGLMTTIKWYAWVFTIVIVCFVSIISVILARETYSEEQEAVRQAVLHVEDMYLEDSEGVNWMADRLFGNDEKIESAQKYFDLDSEAYMKYILNQSSQSHSGTYYILPNEVEDFYMEDPWLTSISFTFNQLPEVYHSDLTNKAGKLEKNFPKRGTDINFNDFILGTGNQDTIGTIKVSILRSKYDTILKNNQNIQPIHFHILSKDAQTIYQSGTKLPSKKKQDYLIKTVDTGEFTFTGYVPKKPVYQRILYKLSLLWIGSFVIIFFLIYLLYRMISSYHYSVSDILHTLNKVGDGDLDVRIAEQGKNSELLEISQSVNQMLNNINEYIVDNYRLENEQKEANIRALQSQINPHFMYNTLEYIRMYAVNVGADELADVVFTFSQLLRNNISQEKFTTLEKEIEFCEKYAFLYQMRYPDCLAYAFKVEEAIKHQQIPKFIIQPLIENYFVHGVDFNKIDNAGSVKAYAKGERIMIDVIDNGIGMTDETLQGFQKMEVNPAEVRQGKSIGIKNIYERLRLYYAGDFKFTFKRNEPTGTIVTIDIPRQKEDQQNV